MNTRLTILAMRSTKTRTAMAKTIIAPALGAILAAARQTAIESVGILRTRLLARRSRVARYTLTLPGHMVAFAAVRAFALLTTVQSEPVRRTRTLARRSKIARPANVFARHMMAGRVVLQQGRALLLAAQTERTAGTRLRAIGGRPAAAADATAGLRIA